MLHLRFVILPYAPEFRDGLFLFLNLGVALFRQCCDLLLPLRAQSLELLPQRRQPLLVRLARRGKLGQHPFPVAGDVGKLFLEVGRAPGCFLALTGDIAQLALQGFCLPGRFRLRGGKRLIFLLNKVLAQLLRIRQGARVLGPQGGERFGMFPFGGFHCLPVRFSKRPQRLFVLGAQICDRLLVLLIRIGELASHLFLLPNERGALALRIGLERIDGLLLLLGKRLELFLVFPGEGIDLVPEFSLARGERGDVVFASFRQLGEDILLFPSGLLALRMDGVHLSLMFRAQDIDGFNMFLPHLVQPPPVRLSELLQGLPMVFLARG